MNPASQNNPLLSMMFITSGAMTFAGSYDKVKDKKNITLVSECVLHVSDCMLRVSDCIAHVSDCIAHVSDCIARVSDCIARVSDGIARVSDGSAHVSDYDVRIADCDVDVSGDGLSAKSRPFISVYKLRQKSCLTNTLEINRCFINHNSNYCSI